MPLVKCPPNSHFESCACPASCQNPKPNCDVLCQPGCVCNPGFLFSNNKCINSSSCDCFYGKSYYKVSPQGCWFPQGRLMANTWVPTASARWDEMNLDRPQGSAQSCGFTMTESFIQLAFCCCNFGFVVLVIKLGASLKPGKCFTTDLYPQPSACRFLIIPCVHTTNLLGKRLFWHTVMVGCADEPFIHGPGQHPQRCTRNNKDMWRDF